MFAVIIFYWYLLKASSNEKPWNCVQINNRVWITGFGTNEKERWLDGRHLLFQYILQPNNHNLLGKKCIWLFDFPNKSQIQIVSVLHGVIQKAARIISDLS